MKRWKPAHFLTLKINKSRTSHTSEEPCEPKKEILIKIFFPGDIDNDIHTFRRRKCCPV
jgi:hypothetical protein